MKVCIVGGIFESRAEIRSVLTWTPEIALASGLRALGHSVTTSGHRTRQSVREFDVVHIHQMGRAAVLMAGEKATTPLVYTSHDGPSLCANSRRHVHAMCSQFVMARADAVVALSCAEAAFQKQHYNLEHAIHSVIPNGIDSELYCFRRKNSPPPQSPWNILYVGQLIKSKRVDVLLKAIARIRRPLVLTLVYQTSTIEEELRALARELGVLDRVRFAGAKAPQELTHIHQSAHLFAFPSDAEALPSVLTEALFCGTPIVSTSVGGIPEQLGGYGVLVPPADECALADGIEKVLDNYSGFLELSMKGAAYARERFAVDRMLQDHVTLYTTIIERGFVRRLKQSNAGLVHYATRLLQCLAT